ncbi:MAG: 50S ribosomal protein L2 [Patescibacteria group bacterium]
MPIKLYKPTTPGRRHMSSLTYEEVTRRSPEKSLTVAVRAKGGRNNMGCITAFQRGGGHRKRYRLVDFRQTDKKDIPGLVTAVEYDPNRTCFVMLVHYADGEKRYHICPNGVTVGTTVLTKDKAKAKPGNRMMLKNIPVGFDIHNLELILERGGQIVRSAGSSAKLISMEGPYAQVQLPSKEVRFVHKECFASIGVVSNPDHFNVKLGKAGRSRWLGHRPKVLGKAKNPVDHPHGGGEGSTPIGLKHPKTPWGMPALGYKTRRRKNPTSRWIVKTRKGKQLIKTEE